jgi:hypothetical protein
MLLLRHFIAAVLSMVTVTELRKTAMGAFTCKYAQVVPPRNRKELSTTRAAKVVQNEPCTNAYHSHDEKDRKECGKWVRPSNVQEERYPAEWHKKEQREPSKPAVPAPFCFVAAHALRQQLCGILSEVGDDEVCSGTTDADERFEGCAVAFEPAFLEGSVEH